MKAPFRTRRSIALFLAAAAAATAASVAADPSPTRADRSEMRAIPSAERNRLAKALASALAGLPVPEKSFAVVEGGELREVAEDAAWDARARQWRAPGTAYAERVYDSLGKSDVEVAGGEEEPELEVRLRLNQGGSLPRDLQSVGGEPALFPLPNVAAVVVSTVKLDSASRLMPQTEAQVMTSLTVLRIYIGNAQLSRYIRNCLKTGSAEEWSPPPGGKPGAVRYIVVEFYGGKRTVERLARRLPVERLRRLLRP